ncbi:MAG TPA: hypothetical protein EYN66_01575 [Myxococcales bacterium]|nr:hypothetical protein [Myxococcales bacterium]
MSTETLYLELTGDERRLVAPRMLKLVQICTGYLLLRWLVWLIARFLLGLRTTSILSLDGHQLRLVSHTHLLGRSIRESEELFLSTDLVSVGVENRFPHLFLLLGALGLIIGSVYGITAVIDGIQAGYLAISLVGFGFLAAGILFDIGLGALAVSVGESVSLLMTVRRKPGGAVTQRFRIVGVDSNEANALVDALSAVTR